jgi:NAD-dependent SIR2 family protein deacetylase
MFGENVPKARVEQAMHAVERADALLVVGSSLMVFSGFRFARRAGERGKPVVILNRGRTRADDIASLRIDEDCERVLPEVVETLLS